ncbi:hypothetical protein [Nocardioides sp. 1609]|nr:hypothetical protein [Nocardioides sp. 1609]
MIAGGVLVLVVVVGAILVLVGSRAGGDAETRGADRPVVQLRAV